MKTIHVKTRKVVAHKANREPVYEEVTQKLSELNPFKTFVKLIIANGYASADVVGVYDSNTKEVSTEESVISVYQEQIDNAFDPVKEKIVDYKAKAESLEERLKALEELVSSQSNNTKKSDPDEEYKQELKDRVKELGGKLNGLTTVDSLENKIKELEESED
jgi:DNA-binding NtrC family response regulator